MPSSAEIITVDPGLCRVVVDHQDFVGQEQQQVALILGPHQLWRNRIELERQIVAEGAVKADIAVLGRMKQIDNHPQHRKHGWRARALLLGKTPVRARRCRSRFSFPCRLEIENSACPARPALRISSKPSPRPL
jgi:hypothetical protein